MADKTLIFDDLPEASRREIYGRKEWVLRMDCTESQPQPDVIVLNGVRYGREQDDDVIYVRDCEYPERMPIAYRRS